MMENYSGFSVI